MFLACSRRRLLGLQLRPFSTLPYKATGQRAAPPPGGPPRTTPGPGPGPGHVCVRVCVRVKRFYLSCCQQQVAPPDPQHQLQLTAAGRHGTASENQNHRSGPQWHRPSITLNLSGTCPSLTCLKHSVSTVWTRTCRSTRTCPGTSDGTRGCSGTSEST